MPLKPNIKENFHYKILSITLVSFQINEGNELDISQFQNKSEITYDVNLGHNHIIQNNNIYVAVNCQLNIKLEDKLLKQLSCSYVGYFQTFDIEHSQLSAEQFATHNAPAIIYPYLRQFIAYITSQMGFPPLTLPIIMLTPDKEKK